MVQITAGRTPCWRSAAAALRLDFAYGSDMVVSTAARQATVSLKDSPLVFAGYGIVAPEYHWDDYKGST